MDVLLCRHQGDTACLLKSGNDGMEMPESEVTAVFPELERD